MPERAHAALKAGLNMKRQVWKLLTRIVLILSLGFVSLLHAADEHGQARRRYAADTQWKKAYDDYEAFLKQRAATGFEVITEFQSTDGGEIIPIQSHNIAKNDIEDTLLKTHEIVLKYRAGIVECSKKPDDISYELKKFIDRFQGEFAKFFVKDDGQARDELGRQGVQIIIDSGKKKRLFSYIAAIHAFQKKKSEMKGVEGKLDEKSPGDKKVMSWLLKTAAVLVDKDKKEIKIENDKIGDVNITELKSADATKGIFTSMDEITSMMDPTKNACLVNWDAPARPSQPGSETPTNPNGNPLPGQTGATQGGPGATTDPTKLPEGGASQPGVTQTLPGTIPSTPGNGDVDLQRLLAEQAAARERDRRQNELDDENVDDLDKLGQLLRGLQPQGSRSADNDRSATGPTFSPSTQVPGGGGSKGQENPFNNPYAGQQNAPADSGLAQLLPLLMSQNKGASDVSPELLKAIAARPNEVPYTPPQVALNNSKQDAFMDTLRWWFMNNMRQQQGYGGGRPNVYGQAPVARNYRAPFNGSFASTGGKGSALRVSGARAKPPVR